MEGRQLRSSTKGAPVPEEDVVGWELYRLGDRCEWSSAERSKLRQLIKESNRALQGVMMGAHMGARRYQIRLDRGDLKAGVAIPLNAVVGTFPSDVHHEESGHIDVLPYREAILQGVRVAMRPHESQDVSTGYDSDLCVSNLWFARPNHIKPSLKLEWVAGGSTGKLFALRGRAAFDLEPGAELTVDLNQVCGNAMGAGPGRWLPYPTGPRALDMRRGRGVIACACMPECTSFVFDDDASITVLRNARLVAWHLGMRFQGPRILPQAISLEDTIPAMAAKLNMDVDRFKSSVLRLVQREDERRAPRRDALRAAIDATQHGGADGGFRRTSTGR